MRIWLIAENWPPRVGGIERYLTGIATHVRGHEITVFAPTIRQTPSTSPSYEGEKSPRVVRKRFSWKPLWPAWLPLFLSLKKLAVIHKPDVIICGKALVEGRVARLLKKTVKIPYVVCTYGMEIATWSTRPRTRARLEAVLRDADKVLYINEKTKEELLLLGVQEKNLVALYPGIDTKKLSAMSNADTVLKKYNITQPYVFSVARLVKRKGVDDLITAFASVTNPLQLPLRKGERTTPYSPPYEGGVRGGLQLVIAGDGPEKASLEKTAKDLKANIVFLGQIPDEDLHALYANAQLFALTPKELPGDYEGFGIVYIEAAYFGLPVVATKTGGVSGAVIHNKTGILATQGDVASIQDALQTILGNPTLAKQYGSAGKERVQKEFTWDKVIIKLEKVIHSILI